MGFRAGGLVVNTILNGIAGALGWALGGLLPGRGALAGRENRLDGPKALLLACAPPW